MPDAAACIARRQATMGGSSICGVFRQEETGVLGKAGGMISRCENHLLNYAGGVSCSDCELHMSHGVSGKEVELPP